MNDLPERLRQMCVGHPNAEIPWPHRILHEAADEIVRLREALHDIAGCAMNGSLFEELALKALYPKGIDN